MRSGVKATFACITRRGITSVEERQDRIDHFSRTLHRQTFHGCTNALYWNLKQPHSVTHAKSVSGFECHRRTEPRVQNSGKPPVMSGVCYVHPWRPLAVKMKHKHRGIRYPVNLDRQTGTGILEQTKVNRKSGTKYRQTLCRHARNP